MARTKDPEAHALRRDAFIDAAEKLMQSKGFERMSIQDVLDETGASKGAFYHYFDSKAALLDAIIERMVEMAVTTLLQPVVDDPDLPALEKLQQLFRRIARWKGERTELVEAILDAWLSDSNALVRERYRLAITRRLSPLLAAIIAQGQAEEVFAPGPPDGQARVLVALILGSADAATELYVARRAGNVTFEQVERTFAAVDEAYERLLGAPHGSITVTEPETLRQWFT